MGRKKMIIDTEKILKQFDAALAAVSYEVGFEIEKAFENAIQEFYDDYPNPLYRRTGYMFYLSDGYADNSLLSNRLGDYQYEAGIEVSPLNVPGNPYEKNPHHGLHVTPRFVYNISYMRGIHGFNRSDLVFKRDRRTGELLRSNKYKDKTGVYRNDNWMPGVNDLAITRMLESNDIYLSRDSFNQFKNSYLSSYNPQHHVPKNAKHIPDVQVKKEYKAICKTIGFKISKALGFLY